MDSFWEAIEEQCKEMAGAKSAEEVVTILKDGGQVWRFHLAFAWHALRYERAEISYRESVEAAWKKFIAGVEF